jgi:hypothetical protein
MNLGHPRYKLDLLTILPRLPTLKIKAPQRWRWISRLYTFIWVQCKFSWSSVQYCIMCRFFRRECNVCLKYICGYVMPWEVNFAEWRSSVLSAISGMSTFILIRLCWEWNTVTYKSSCNALHQYLMMTHTRSFLDIKYKSIHIEILHKRIIK